ncbi:MAG: (deoxy)nucleoside triphosphate pyrophosphohydrolase [Aurantimicrobium sp.]|nr:(deoxy)nucleoside triphosphate pyrophosphohydrolase [Aurantimicrobium sp.]
MEPIRVVAAVIERDGKILACRRAPHKSLAGLWEFPGGKVEPGETDEVALAREILEELGLIIEVGNQIFEVQDSSSDILISLVFLRATLMTSISSFALTDHDKAEFLKLEEISRVAWSPLDKKMAANLKDLSIDLA